MNLTKLGSRAGLALAAAGFGFFTLILSIHDDRAVIPFLALSIPSFAAYLWAVQKMRDSPQQKTAGILLASLGLLLPAGALMLLGLVRMVGLLTD